MDKATAGVARKKEGATDGKPAGLHNSKNKMKQYAQRDLKKFLHYYTFPRWSAEKKYLILLCSIIAMAGGLCGAFLTHMQIPSATFFWHMGIATTSVCLYCFFKETYQTYMDTRNLSKR